MVIEAEQVISIIDAGVDKKIMLARKKAEKINMHITGKKVIEYLETLDDYETIAQKKLREKLVKSNRSLFSFILRPLDKIFTAKGGSVNYNSSQQQIEIIKEAVSDVADGLDIKTYLKKSIKKHYIIDPNGILFVDIDKEGMLETHFVNTKNIFWYENKGNVVKAIIFAPYKNDKPEDRNKEFFRVVDSETDRIFVKEGSSIYESTSDRLDNYFGFVPAMIVGDEKCPNEHIYESIIGDLVEDADDFLRDLSVKTVHKLSHGYPRYWAYEQACIRCGGEGTISSLKTAATETEPAVYDTLQCPSCGGTGNKQRNNPSDITILRAPQEGEKPITPHVMGFSSPDLETWKFYEVMEEKGRNRMFQAMWGTTYEQGGKRETATGRFLDAQPVQDKLRGMSETFSKMHKFILDCYGKVVLRNVKYESSVSYGMRYILEGPDDVLDKYIETSRERVSELAVLDLRNRYFEAEYQNDPLELAKRKKLAKVEPFPTMTVKEVKDIEGIMPFDILSKAYYSSWVSTLTDAEIILLSENELRNKLTDYINLKQLTNANI